MNRFLKYFMMLLTLLLIVVPVILLSIYIIILRMLLQSSYNKSDAKRHSTLRNSKINPSKNAISILFLGIDDNEGRRKNGQTTEHSRTDSMILATLSPNKQQIRLLSIPRDTISYIPKVGYYENHTRMPMEVLLLLWILLKPHLMSLSTIMFELIWMPLFKR